MDNPTHIVTDLILVVYEVSRLQRALKIAHDICELINVRQVVIVINNPLISDDMIHTITRQTLSKVVLLRHDNTGLEFGAYQKGLDNIKYDLPDRLIVMNDTVGTHQFQYFGKYFMRVFCRRLVTLQEQNFAIGTVERSVRQFRLHGLATSTWIRSNIMGFDKQAIMGVHGVLYSNDLVGAVAESSDEGRFFSAMLNENFKRHLRLYLFVPGAAAWYAAAPLTAENSRKLSSKASAILQEIYFSMRMAHADTALFHMYSSPKQSLLDSWVNRVYIKGKKIKSFFSK